MDLGLKDKVALVTGAGSPIGFGRAIALTLAREGCDIVANDVNAEEVKQAAAVVEALGRKAIGIKADVSNSAEVNDMVKIAMEKFGKIDILVNNAGATIPGKPFAEKPVEEWEPDINVTLKGVLICTKAVIDNMISRKSGKIINISSGAGKTGGMNATVYGAAKAGVIAFTKGLAAEVAAIGINVNSVAPGLANTGFAKDAPPEFLKSTAAMVPLKRLTEPQDIANMVAFLASDVASDIVGQTFSVDGGLTMY
jgi:NAD(P)-dependent dehydrogenase (short-subunit alcohol dehydrogenase family)